MRIELSGATLSALAKHKSALEQLLTGAPEPRMTTVSDKDGTNLNGNQSSYIRLAVDCLTAAQGKPVSLWRDAYGLQTGGWRFNSLQVDPDAGTWGWHHRSLPSTLRCVFWISVSMLACVGLWTLEKDIYLWMLRSSS